MKYKHLGHSSNITIHRKCCKVTFSFWIPGGGGGGGGQKSCLMYVFLYLHVNIMVAFLFWFNQYFISSKLNIIYKHGILLNGLDSKLQKLICFFFV